MNTTPNIANEFIKRHPVAAARRIEALPDAALETVVEGLDPAALAIGMEYLSPAKSAAVFDAVPEVTQLEILERALPRLAVTVLAQLDADQCTALLSGLRPVTRDDLERLLDYPDNSAGRLMDRQFLTVEPEMRVGEVLEHLRGSAIRRARSLFVVDDEGRLAGRIDIQDLALADANDTIAGFIHPIGATATTQSSREDLVELLDQARSDAVPVVDADRRLVGVVRYPSLFQAIEDVASTDMQKMVGASPEERALSGAGFAIRRRLPWLHINLLTAFLAAAVVGLFESLIAQFTALAVLLPVVAGQSGNAGAQALAVTMRGLALREIGIRQWRGVLGKEVSVGLINGIALAVTCGLAVYVWSQSIGLAVVIAVAMILSMLAAGIAGALIPIMLTRMGQDPATASSILLTTITDVAGFFSFLTTALLLSSML